MESIQLTSTPVPAETAARKDAPARRPRAVAIRNEAILRERVEGLSWTYRASFAEILSRVPAEVWAHPERQDWTHIKQNAARQVWRAEIGGRAFYLKYYINTRWTHAVKDWLRRPACEAEWLSGIYALQCDIPAVVPAGYTRVVLPGVTPRWLLVTDAVEPAYPLLDYWRLVQGDPETRRQRADTAQLAEALGEMLAHAHQSGFEHRDMHAANILVQPVGGGLIRTLFVDLHNVRLGVPISDRAAVRNLVQLNQWFHKNSTIGDRLRFLRSYARWRNEYEQAFPHARPLGLSFEQLVHALADVAHLHAERLYAQRDRRLHRDGRYFQRVSLPGGWRGSAFRRAKQSRPESLASELKLDGKWWRSALSNPLRWFEGDAATDCKRSHSAMVRSARLSAGDGSVSVIMKRPLARNWRRRLAMMLSSRARRGWVIGNALLHRDLPTARPLAYLERRFGPLVLDSMLITERLPEALDLSAYLRWQYEERSPRAWLHEKRRMIDLLARQLRALEARGFVHRDCKAQNLLVLNLPQPSLFWIDMDGLRRKPHLSDADKLRPLVRLGVSLCEQPGVTRADYARFLQSYAARFGAPHDAWRKLWRAAAPRIVEKQRQLAERRAWKLEHYGRV